ncbi:MBL fold metallo-hydrolase [Candidatus Gracilibacteria bacterium]|nr:MBL fold metallo-hydrolase [Candidatus Gracilibacteria bacterium]
MIFKQLIDAETSTYTYLLADEVSKEAVIIDPVIEQVARDTKLIKELGLSLKYILDTHVHADHITGSGNLRKIFPDALIALGQENKLKCANINLEDQQELNFGKYNLTALQTPGHTAGCVTYTCENMVFTGDLLLIKAAGRTDFQSGSNEKMYSNIQEKIYSLPEDTIIYPGHDYNGFTSSTVGEEKQFNTLISSDTSLEDFTQSMDNLNLAYPKKIDVSLPANKLCGE